MRERKIERERERERVRLKKSKTILVVVVVVVAVQKSAKKFKISRNKKALIRVVSILASTFSKCILILSLRYKIICRVPT